MKNKRRSAFTIVELVIVIAVIAILSAVLIPTFGAIIRDANEAADNAAAATLTSELHVYLKGNTIDSEEELMAALKDSGIGEKLVPKALSYGHHFWFNMENQMIIAGYAEDIAALGQSEGNNAGDDSAEGAQAVSAVIVNNTNDNANTSLRDVYGKKIFFIDYTGELGDIVNTIDTLAKGTDYERVVKGLLAFENEDDKLGEKLLEAVRNTIIISNAGSFYCEGASGAKVAFVNGGIGAISKHFVADANGNVTEKDASVKDESTGELVNKLPSVSGNVVLPDGMSFVGDNALNFTGSANVVVSEDRVETVFCESATNAIINNQYTIAGDKLMDGETEVATLVSLEGRFPGYSFSILQQDDLAGDTYAWNNGTLYVNYYAFVDQGGKLELVLTEDGQTAIPDTVGYVTWSFDGGVTVGTLIEEENTIYNVISVTDDGHAKATVTLLDGNKGEFEFDVVVVKPDSATVSIGDKNIYVPYDGLGQRFEWGYDGSDGAETKNISISNLEYSHGFANSAPALDITADYEGVFEYDAESMTLTLKQNADGTIALAKNAETGATITEYTLTFTVDGIITSTAKVTVNDYTNARLISNYNHKNEAPYYYYIGNGTINLGHILKLKNTNDLPFDSNVVIEAETGDGYADVNRIEFEQFEASTSTAFTSEAWSSATITFNSKVQDNFEIPVRIKITPNVLSEGACTITINVKYINATNVVDADGLFDAAEDGGNVVMMSNITIAQGVTAENYHLDFETGETLYGNGFVLSAKTFIASGDKDGSATEQKGTRTVYTRNETQGTCTKCGGNPGLSCLWGAICSKPKIVTYVASSVACDYYLTDKHLISLDGATVDNIYLGGPVYAGMQYHMIANTVSDINYADSPFYVSGIKTTGSAVIQNSYVSGFRAPVAAAGTLLTINNSTIRGGNYANIDVVDGNLTMTNVVTVQDQDGQTATVGVDGTLLENSNISVAGAGIMLGKDSTDSVITINGYFNQYNWIQDVQGATMPNIDGISLTDVVSWIFDGMPIMGDTRLGMNRLRRHTHEYGTTDTEYVNAGVIFAVIGTNEDIAGYPTGSSSSLIAASQIIDNRTDKDGTAITDSKLKYTRTELETFSNLGTANYGLDWLIDTSADKILGKDGKVIIFSRTDGRTYKTGGFLDAEHDTDIKLSDADIIYSGYYDGNGYYADYYVVNEANILPTN